MYKEASKQGLRVDTSKGSLSVEQLWSLDLKELDALAVSLEDKHKNSKGKSFLEKRTTADKGLKLQFDIVLDILQTKADAAESSKNAREIKEHNEKIITLISEKKDGELKGKSIKQLEAMIK